MYFENQKYILLSCTVYNIHLAYIYNILNAVCYISISFKNVTFYFILFTYLAVHRDRFVEYECLCRRAEVLYIWRFFGMYFAELFCSIF